MDVLGEITAARARQRQLRKEVGDIDDHVAELIRAAFDAGFTGPQIAVAAGISKARAYQIRDGQ